MPQLCRGYSAGVLVGNYSEEVDQISGKLAALINSSGDLASDRYQARLQRALEPVLLSQSSTACHLHFGDVVQLAHAATGCVLSVNVDEQVPNAAMPACAATAAADVIEPVARNALLLVRAPIGCGLQQRDDQDRVLRFGQSVRLVAHPLAQGLPLDSCGGDQPLALYSLQRSTTHAAPLSRHQLVGFTWRTESYECVWKLQHAEPSKRLASEGQPVPKDVPVLLVHAATGAPLRFEAQHVYAPRGYGQEHEVSAAAATCHGRQRGLEHAARGDDVRTLPGRAVLDCNVWRFVCGSEVMELPAPPRSMLGTVNRQLSNTAQQVAARPGARRALERKLTRLSDNSGCIRESELALVFAQVGCVLEDAAELAQELADQHTQAHGGGGAAAGAPQSSRRGVVHTRALLDALDAAAVNSEHTDNRL